MGVFSAALQEKIKHYCGRYETKRSAILPVLHAIQDECGWIKDEHIEELHKSYDLNRVHVREVLTFYSMFRDQECKPYRIYFCNNIVCCMMGSDQVMAKIEDRLKAEEQRGETKFSLEGVPCLGVCDGAPAMLVNKDRYLKVSTKNVDEILTKYK